MEREREISPLYGSTWEGAKEPAAGSASARDLYGSAREGEREGGKQSRRRSINDDPRQLIVVGGNRG